MRSRPRPASPSKRLERLEACPERGRRGRARGQAPGIDRRGEPPSSSAPARDRAFRRALLSWYDANRRDLPWRRDRDSYRVWVAEVMLQQTRIEVVVPAYRRFLGAFPSVARLAHSDEERVLSFWSGLGYYSRARALHRAAKTLHRAGRNAFPSAIQDALALPGVGPYTAAAVLSIAHRLPYATVDGNVNRVLSRLACLAPPNSRGEPQRALAERLLDRGRPGDWNQAMMELGQTVCLPRAPRCGDCPVRRFCAAERSGSVRLYPHRRPRRKLEQIYAHLTIFRDPSGSLLLERGAFPYLPHLWLPPIRVETGSSEPVPSVAAARKLGAFRHAIVHRRFEVSVYEASLRAAKLRRMRGGKDLPGSVERRVFDAASLDRIGKSALLTKALRLLEARPRRARTLGRSV